MSADWLNAPHIIQNASKQDVWTWDHYAFGDNASNQNPSGLGAFVYNQRFPGQYKDVETNLNYNYFRDYNPTLGKYVESDPLGLLSGINTYGYVNGDPPLAIDFYGLYCFAEQSTPSVVVSPACLEAYSLVREGVYGEL